MCRSVLTQWVIQPAPLITVTNCLAKRVLARLTLIIVKYLVCYKTCMQVAYLYSAIAAVEDVDALLGICLVNDQVTVAGVVLH